MTNRRSIPIMVALAVAATACAPSFTLSPPSPDAYPPQRYEAASAGERREAPAINANGDALTLADAIAYAAHANPRARAALARYQAAAQRSAQVTPPDPMIDYTVFISSVETRVGPQQHVARISQRIPWPGRLAAQAAAHDSDAEAARLGFEIAARDAIAAVTIAYHELAYLQAATTIVAETQRVATQLADIAEAWLARESPAGASEPLPREAVPLIDALKARAQVAQLAYDQVTIAENLDIARADFLRAAGLPFDTDLPPVHAYAPPALTLDRDALFQFGLAHRQELAQAAAREQSAGRRVEAAQLMAVPDITLGAQWIVVGPRPGTATDDLENDALSLMFGITLPIWGGRNQAAVDEAAHLQEAARADAQAMALDYMAALVKVHTAYARAMRLVELYDERLVPDAVDALARLTVLQREGEASFGEILEAQALLLNFQLARERAATDALQALARLEQLIGTPLAGLAVDDNTRDSNTEGSR